MGDNRKHDAPYDGTVPLTRAGSETPGPTGCVLYVADGPAADRGRSVRLTVGRALVGSGEECELRLSDPTVSHHHAEFSVKSDGVLVRDSGSTNGVLHLGQRIESALLQPGVRLEIGRCSIDILPLATSASLPASTATHYGDLIGSSIAMRRLYTLLSQLEGSDAPVLLQGETGTGKELVARAIHGASKRSNEPYVVIDCCNLQPGVIRSEIFGHAKGAFTGATDAKSGSFEDANGGTVLLDEIGDLPLDLQPSLLRVLETGTVQRMGETRSRHINVRVIAATHRDVAENVSAGEFREDLFYRLAVISVHLPALRDRTTDVPLLANHLANLISKGRITKLPDSVLSLMVGYDWPGNVRELRNAVHRVLSLGSPGIGPTTAADPELLPEPVVPSQEGGALLDTAFKAGRIQAIHRFEAAYLQSLLKEENGNLTGAAKRAGIDRKYLRDLLKKHGLYQDR